MGARALAAASSSASANLRFGPFEPSSRLNREEGFFARQEENRSIFS